MYVYNSNMHSVTGFGLFRCLHYLVKHNILNLRITSASVDDARRSKHPINKPLEIISFVAISYINVASVYECILAGRIYDCKLKCVWRLNMITNGS